MTNICFYVSDYGYGHASRDIAIIRKIMNKYKVKIFVKTDGPFHFVKQSLPQKNVEVIPTKNDIGVVFKKDSVSVGRERTEKMLDEWLVLWDNYIHNEKTFCQDHKIDLILSDIVPQSFIVANELDIPGIAISNFTWHYIFYNLFGDNFATRRIKEAYQHATIALVLPFSEEMNLFKDKESISLISRKITMDKYALRKKYNLSDDEILVYIGIGRSFDPSYLKKIKKINKKNVKILVSSNSELPFENVIKIPINETETQNYIAMCDLVISKPGYGTVSEAVRAKVPMFLLQRNGFKEDELITNVVEKLGIGSIISEKCFLDGNWINKLDEINNVKAQFDNIPKRFIDDGSYEVVDIIENLGYLRG